MHYHHSHQYPDSFLNQTQFLIVKEKQTLDKFTIGRDGA